MPTLCRGLVRQLGKPALLAATYKGDAAAIATAAMEEMESTLVDTLTQLERSSPGTPGAFRHTLCVPASIENRCRPLAMRWVQRLTLGFACLRVGPARQFQLAGQTWLGFRLVSQ